MDENNYPANWTVKSLEDICQILDSKRIPINNSERNERITGKNEFDLYPYYGATGQVGLIDDFIFEGEYILVGEDGAPFLDPIKQKAFIVNGKFWVNNHAHILLAHTSNKFLCHYLNLFNYSDFVTGTTRLKLNQALLRKIPVPIPPLNEQKRIVAKIEELFSELDNGIASLKTAREQLKVYRQAVLKHAFEGKLTAKWREENADKLESPEQLLARIQQEREARYQQQLKDWETAVKEWDANGKDGKKPGKPKKLLQLTQVSEKLKQKFQQLPANWSYIRLGKLIDEPAYGTSAKCDYETGDQSVLRIPNVSAGKIDDSDLKFANFEKGEVDHLRLMSGDILTIRSNGSISLVGSCALINEKDTKHIFAGYLIRLRPNKKTIKSEYLLAVMSSHFIRKQIESAAKSTSGVNNINSGELQNLIIPLTSIQEQEELISRLDSMLPLISSTEIEIDKQLTKAETLRQSILKKAFSGQLVPQDPSDEPASELLARIQAEKESVNTQKAQKTKKILSSDGH